MSDCGNTVPCPYCQEEFHVCPVFESPEGEVDPEDLVEYGGQERVRCGNCYKQFILVENIALVYSSAIDPETEATGYLN